ncbi:MAG: LysM peptidoglycan-binding domain-containing protein [Chloroflexota bacterium]
MNAKRFLAVFLFLCLLLFFGVMVPAQASSSGQAQYATPTAGPDGRIIYIIQPGDSCTRISLLNGITQDQLMALNPELGDCTLIQEGQELMLGIGGPAAYSPTPGPSPTLAPPTMTPTPPPGTTEICVLLYDDVNGDALRQETELGVAGGAVSVSNSAGTYSETQVTVSAIDPDTEEPQQVCFTDVPEGEYTISMAVPDTYNPTMSLTNTFSIKAGDRAFVDFSAQLKTVTVSEAEAESSGGGSSPILGILGGLLLLGGLGLGWYAFQQRKPESRLKGGGLGKK